MDKTVDAHCPGEDPSRKRTPEILACPKADCDGEVEIWSDEDSGKCSTCKGVFAREALS